MLMIESLISYITLIAYIVALGIILSLIYSIAEWFSKDRVIKLFEGRKVVAILNKEGYYGKLLVPPRSGGGFEILFELKSIENPQALISFLLRGYKETKDMKFLEEAKRVMMRLKERRVLDEQISLENIEVHPWSEPSLVSRKVYPSEIKDLHVIAIFSDKLDEKERALRRRELRRLYKPSLLSRTKRRIYNALAYVKDKISGTITSTTTSLLSAASTISPEVRKAFLDLEKKAIATMGALYDALLENSIGSLITLKVQEPSGEIRYYQGILREYSNYYIAVYDVDYKLVMVTKFKERNRLKGYPQPAFKVHAFRMVEEEHLIVKDIHRYEDAMRISIQNVYDDFVKIRTIVIDGKSVKVDKVLEPGGLLDLSTDSVLGELDMTIYYEISKKADVIWPRAKVQVVGLGDYPSAMFEYASRLRI
ncbi:MAG: hypothetical protein DRN15_09150 [Thermoprotei archaeon]|nr:MAG: hypothetical protein DRN15_09150 [Thermoprotei archaeon]RLF24820.1 MAG: hypothetical protein DRM97_02960 [Thermoprotei archaeon]